MSPSTGPRNERRTEPTGLLESWKEIAAHFKRGVRTVRRWEKDEGLPVHRQVHQKLGTVYAYTSELEAWRSSRSAPVASAPGDRARDARTGSARVMIAVLPFESLSGDSEQDYLADGLTEEMIGQLGRLKPGRLGVIARTTMMQYKRAGRTVRQIAAELCVDYVLEGSVRREGERVRVTGHLVDVHDQSHVWSGAYDQATRSVLALQRELAADIGREIHLTISPGDGEASAGIGAVSPDAYDAHLKGRRFLNSFTPESVRQSEQCFRRAIEADPSYAPAYASLAEALERLPMWVDHPAAKTLPLAIDAANRALELDPTLPEAHASLGMIAANYLWDWTNAERHFQRALELNPACSPARLWYAEFLAELGRFDEALDTIERARMHDPRSPAVLATVPLVLVLGRRFDEAIAQAQQVLDVYPDYPMALIRLGVACSAKGMHAKAVRAFASAEQAAPGLLDCISLQGYAQARAGNEAGAVKQLGRLRRLAGRRYVPAFLFANVYVGLGDYDRALQLMEQEYDARGWYMLLIKHSPQYDPLRSHPRFEALLSRMHFPNQ